MKILLLSILVITVNLTGISQVKMKLDVSIKDEIVENFENFEGEVNQASIDELIFKLKTMSTDSAEMCFTTLGLYNDCQDNSETLYPILESYLDDLIGKEIMVEFYRWNQPWLDEDFYSLSFKLIYKNDNPNYPVEENFDTIILDVNKGEIKNIIYAREWIDLAIFGS